MEGFEYSSKVILCGSHVVNTLRVYFQVRAQANGNEIFSNLMKWDYYVYLYIQATYMSNLNDSEETM